jgi:hypothetical protein
VDERQIVREEGREEGRKEGREEERQKRDFELLKHVSTLNIISLVLVQALLEDANAPLLPPVIVFSISLLLAMSGLTLTNIVGWDAGKFVRVLTAFSYLAFLLGLTSAVLVPFLPS